MKITGIYSTRNYNTWPSWHIVFEYEDKFAECLGIKITRGGKKVLEQHTIPGIQNISRVKKTDKIQNEGNELSTGIHYVGRRIMGLSKT